MREGFVGGETAEIPGHVAALRTPPLPLPYSSTSYRVGKRCTDGVESGGGKDSKARTQWLDLSVSLSQRVKEARCVTGV